MGDHPQLGILPQYVTSQLGQLNLASLWGSLNQVRALFAWGKVGNVIPYGM